MIKKLLLITLLVLFLSGCKDIPSPVPPIPPPEPTPPVIEENHNTEIVYRIAHSTPARSFCLHDLWEMGFNVIHMNDSMKMELEHFEIWLGKCQAKDMLFLPRITYKQAEEILPHIKDHPSLAGVACWDELDCEEISKESQKKFAELCERVAPNVLRFGTINQGWWDRWCDFDSWDIIMASCFPNLEEWENEEAMNRQLQRIEEWCPKTKPLMITLRGVDAGQGVPNIVDQYHWWDDRIPGGMNSYCIYLHGAGNPHTGFSERDDMKEQVKKLNEEVKTCGGS